MELMPIKNRKECSLYFVILFI